MPTKSTEARPKRGRPFSRGDLRLIALRFIVQYHREHHYAPSTQEIGALLRLGHTTTRHHLDVLAKQGMVTFVHGEPSRTIVPTRKGIATVRDLGGD